MTPRKAVIPAAGLGSRFLPATKVVPKELLPIFNRPALEFIVEELVESQIEEIILVISPGKEAIVEHFARGGATEKILTARNKSDLLEKHYELLKRCSFRKVIQKEPLGLGHAVLLARKEVGNEPFVVALPDDLVRSKTPCMKQLMNQYSIDGISTVAVEEVSLEDVSRYGIVAGPGMKGRNPFRVNQIIEKPAKEKAPSRFAIIGRYLLDPTIFEALDQVKPGAIGEIQLTDGLAIVAREKGLLAYPFEGLRLDAGTPAGFVEANLMYAMDDPETKKRVRSFIEKMAQA